RDNRCVDSPGRQLPSPGIALSSAVVPGQQRARSDCAARAAAPEARTGGEPGRGVRNDTS
ncbi:hypothetical protein ABZ686_25245, partial [Streptomyces sp. NPDC006992]|uniref:hypothetical protein n=1 Tax=Streptomyces sp. NPDC006992 TaxID=3155601 RepID=UPI003407378B